MSELRKLSTRAEITTTSFTNEYHFGDFRGNPRSMMEKYFDAFLYYANWGTHWFMLRLPAKLVDVKAMKTVLRRRLFFALDQRRERDPRIPLRGRVGRFGGRVHSAGVVGSVANRPARRRLAKPVSRLAGGVAGRRN